METEGTIKTLNRRFKKSRKRKLLQTTLTLGEGVFRLTDLRSEKVQDSRTNMDIERERRDLSTRRGI